jgi:serine/threonine-protein phosphatase 2B catalytic subunit
VSIGFLVISVKFLIDSHLLMSYYIVTEMLLAILSICSQEELDSESDGEEVAQEEEALRTEAVAARRQAIKNKIMAVGRMQKVFQILRFVVLL